MRRKNVEIEGNPKDWGYKKRIRIVATKKGRQMRKRYKGRCERRIFQTNDPWKK